MSAANWEALYLQEFSARLAAVEGRDRARCDADAILEQCVEAERSRDSALRCLKLVMACLCQSEEELEEAQRECARRQNAGYLLRELEIAEVQRDELRDRLDEEQRQRGAAWAELEDLKGLVRRALLCCPSMEREAPNVRRDLCEVVLRP